MILLEWTAEKTAATIDDNATFTVGSGPDIPTLASTTLRIGHDADIFGTGATFLDGSIDWLMAGLGTLTAADRSYLTGRDATDPYPGDLTRQSRPSLVWTCAATDSANVPDNDHSALDGYAPAVQRVGENWTKVANGMLTWSVPQARAVSLLGRVADAGIIGSPVDSLTAELSDGDLNIAQRQSSASAASLTFSNTTAGNQLVAYARAKDGTTTFTWPVGWTVQSRGRNGRWRAEVATATAVGGTTETVTVTTGGTANSAAGVEINGVSGLVGTISLTPHGSVSSTSLSGSAAYQTCVLFYDAHDPQLSDTPLWDDTHPRDSEWAPRLTTAHPIVSIKTPLTTFVSNLAPGTVKWNPGTIWYTTKVVDVLDDSGKPTGQKKEVLVSHFRPAEGGILFGLTFSTAATAPSLPAGQYEVGVTAVMADGSESPLLLTETLSTTGIRAIATTWAARSSITAGLTQWRVYKLRKGGSWYYEAVEPETNTLTITSETTGTQSSPPLVTELSGIEMYAVARAASDARPVYELPSVSLQVGDGKFEAAELGMLPNPLVPGGADQVLIELWARSSIGYRTLFIDQVRFLPIFQHRGSLFARIRGDEPSVPLRWTGYGDNLGLSGYRLHGTLGDIDVANGVYYGEVGLQDVNDPDWIAPRVRNWDASANLDPTRSFGMPAPSWHPVRKGTTFTGLTLQTKDATTDAYADGVDTWVLEFLRSASTTIEQAQGPVTPVTAGAQYRRPGISEQRSGKVRSASGSMLPGTTRRGHCSRPQPARRPRARRRGRSFRPLRRLQQLRRLHACNSPGRPPRRRVACGWTQSSSRRATSERHFCMTGSRVTRSPTRQLRTAFRGGGQEISLRRARRHWQPDRQRLRWMGPIERNIQL